MENTTAIRRMDRPVKSSARCKRGSAQSATERTRRTHRNGFLKHRFTPFWQYVGSKARAEKEFFRSLTNLCDYYAIQIPETAYSFPQNIYQTQLAVNEKIKAVDDKIACIIAKDENHAATLATIKRFDTRMTLYYIPVRPLWHWMQCSQTQPLAELILCIFGYLEQVVKVPYFTGQDSYLASQYETLAQWVNDDDAGDEDFREKQLGELYTLQNAGLKIYQQIIDPQRLAEFQKVIQDFKCTEQWQDEWHGLAVKFFELYQAYPQRSVFDHIHPELMDTDGEDRIYADWYISFYWSGNDCFQDCLFDMIDNHFQEIAYIDEPAHLTLFDSPPVNTSPDFDFETRLFDLINELSSLLNPYDHEQCEPTI